MGIRGFVISALLLVLSVSGISQETPVVHKINGKKVYLHVVEPGNTLYGISKLYSVPIAIIEAENPILKEEGLKVNQTLLIQVNDANKKELTAVVEQSNDFITHQVQPKETLYSICKHYNVELSEVLAHNPEVEKEGLKSGSEIRIPIKEATVKEKQHVEVANYDTLEGHIVQKGETLYALSKKYNVSVDELKEANNSLPFGLKEGMVIRVPGSKVDIPDDVLNELDSILADSSLAVAYDSSKSIRIALLLPFSPRFPDTSSVDEFKIPESDKIPLNFYRGFVYALDSFAQKEGLHVNLSVFDTGKDTLKLPSILSEVVSDSAQIVIGPFFTNQFEYVADALAASGIPVICPVPKPSKILFERPNAIKTAVSEPRKVSSLARFLAHTYRDSNLILVNSNKFQDQENIEFFKAQYSKALGLPDTVTDESIREIKLWDINFETLTMRLKDSGAYTIVIPSTRKVFVTRLLGELYNLKYETKDKYQFTVVGLSQWRKFDSDIEIAYLHELNVIIPLSGHIDYADYRVEKLIENYTNTHGFEPDKFAMLGFDLANSLVFNISTHGQEWWDTPESFGHQGIVNDFHFTRIIEGSGIENESVSFYRYEDFKLKEIGTWPQSTR